MGKYDLRDDSFDNDTDDDDPDLDGDIQNISQAFLDTAPGDSSAVATANQFDSTAADSSDSDADLELLRDVQLRYGASAGSDPSPQPDFGLPMVNSDSDCEDDVEYVQAIKRRFGQDVASGTDCGAVGEPDFGLPTVDSDSDDEEELLREIQRRYARYTASGTNVGGVGEFEGGMSSNNCDDLNSPVDEMLNARVSDGFDENEDEEGLSDLALDMNTLVDGIENRASQGLEFPEPVRAFADAIKKNRLAQKQIREQMTKVEGRMEKVKGLIPRAKVLWNFDVQGRRKMILIKDDDRMQLISVPNKDKRIGSAMKKGPNENSRVENYRKAFSDYPQWISRERWRKEERRNLQKGIIQQLQKWLLHKSMERMEDSEEGPGCSDGVDEIMSKIGGLNVDPQTIRSFLPNVDWNDVASTYLPKRSGRECLARWMNFEDPLINFGNWTGLEDKSLSIHIQRMGHNWVAVAEALGLNRTPFQCLMRYQRSLNPCMIKRDWTPVEDDDLTAAVQTYGESNWTVVASVLKGRTGPQCSNRWRKTLLPSKQRKGRWNPDEDKRFKIAVMLMGSRSWNWNKIAEFVPGRTESSCRERWVNNLDPSLNHGIWTEEEDAKLEEAIRVHGFRWAKVATCVPPRTDSQCRRRWTILFPEDALRAQAERKVAKAALPSNFVDREHNRSSLRASDFIPLPLANTDADGSGNGKKKATRRKKSCKISDKVFCNIPKKPRSRRCRRVGIVWEVPVIHRGHSSEMTDTRPSNRRTRGSSFKQKKHAEADSTLADLKKSLKGARKKRKERENETIGICKHAKVDVQRESSVNRDEDAGYLCTSGSVVKGKLSSGEELDGSSVLMGEEHQEEYSSIASGSELVNCSGDETIASLREITRKQSKRRKLRPVEPEEWENVPLASLFGKTATLRKGRTQQVHCS